MRTLPIAALVVLFGALSACEQEVREMPEDRVDVPGRDTPVIRGGVDPAEADPELVRAMAEERRAAAEHALGHVATMRALSSEEWYEHRDHHVRETRAFLSVLERQFATLHERWGEGDPRVGEVMGVPGAEQHALLSEMAAVRDDLEILAEAPAWEVRGRMPQHVDRLETLAEIAGRSARRVE